MTRDLEDFKNELGSELTAAAHRQATHPIQRSRTGVRPRRSLALACAFCAMVLLGAGSLLILRSEPASAEVLEVTQTANNIVIDVVRLITDAEHVEREITDKTGLTASLTAVPASPEVEGRITAFGSDDDVAVDVDADGTIRQIVIANEYSGPLDIQFGRRAEPGEAYVATTDSTRCREFWGSSPTEAADEILSVAPTLRFQTIDSTGRVEIDQSYAAIGEDFRIVSVLPLSSESALVTFSQDPGSWQRHPNCT